MPAAKAGMQVGDIVIAVGDNEIDQNGNYVDPLYGKIEFTNLITSTQFRRRQTADPSAARGQANAPRSRRSSIARQKITSSRPIISMRPPPTTCLGGLIFQELSRQFLKEWGGNWVKDAPQRFVYFDRFQSELFPEGNRRVVILTQVLPANSTIGYDDLAYLTVVQSERQRSEVIARCGGSGQAAARRIHQSGNRRRSEANRARRRAGRERSRRACSKTTACPSLQRLE